MLYRLCPECKNKTLRIPLVSSAYICRECVSVFTLHTWQKMLYRVVMAVVLVATSYVALLLLVGGKVSLAGYAGLVYLGLPLVGSIACKMYCMYFGKLKLSGVKGRLRAST